MGTSRRAILDANGLLGAPVAQQRLFWLSRSRRHRRRGEPARLGDIALGVASDEALASLRQLDDVALCWERVVPAACAGRTRVDGLRQGRLVVYVDSAATKYSLSRQLGQGLVGELNAAMKETVSGDVRRVNRIEYRVGAIREWSPGLPNSRETGATGKR